MADTTDLAQAVLGRMGGPDAYVGCTAEGCRVRVHISANPVLCRFHGGPRVAQYETSATDAAIFWAAYMTRTGDIDAGGDCE